MAESVDALVSNTSGAIRAGSIPAPGTYNRKPLIFKDLRFFFWGFAPRLLLLEKFRMGAKAYKFHYICVLINSFTFIFVQC